MLLLFVERTLRTVTGRGNRIESRVYVCCYNIWEWITIDRTSQYWMWRPRPINIFNWWLTQTCLSSHFNYKLSQQSCVIVTTRWSHCCLHSVPSFTHNKPIGRSILKANLSSGDLNILFIERWPKPNKRSELFLEEKKKKTVRETCCVNSPTCFRNKEFLIADDGCESVQQ